LTEDGEREKGNGDPKKAPFLPILIYVFGFLLILALLAYVFAGLLRR
jgi:hypothetical protein